jgi:hypothetical protein
MRNSTGTVVASHRFPSFDAMAANAGLPVLFPSERQVFLFVARRLLDHRAVLRNSVQEARLLG